MIEQLQIVSDVLDIAESAFIAVQDAISVGEITLALELASVLTEQETIAEEARTTAIAAI